jgi:hypothetical protein
MRGHCVVGGDLAVATPRVADASDLWEQCAGANVRGLGSTLQEPAEEVWAANFNAQSDTNVFGCAGQPG